MLTAEALPVSAGELALQPYGSQIHDYQGGTLFSVAVDQAIVTLKLECGRCDVVSFSLRRTNPSSFLVI